METRIESRDGWVEVTHAGVHVLTKGDAALRERLQAAVSEAGEESLADVVTDELTASGMRRTPDFAIVDEADGRVLVRGSASVQLVGDDGTAREIVAPRRGPWTDEDLDEGLRSVVLGTGEPEAAPATEPASDETDPEVPGAQPSAGGWALPSVFGGAGSAAAQPGTPSLSVVSDPPSEPGSTEQPTSGHPDPEPMPVEEGSVVKTPAPRGQDIVGEEPTARPDLSEADPASGPASAADAGGDGDEDDLPSFDFLFGNTSHHRRSLVSGLEAEEDGEGAIDSGPVAAAGGYQAPENPTNATLAPLSEDREDEAPSQPTPTQSSEDDAPISAVPGGVPPMPGSDGPPAEDAPVGADAAAESDAQQQPSTVEEDEDAPVAVPVGGDSGPAGPARVQAAHDDQSGHEPGGGFPQFFDGHLVGSRVPEGGTPAADAPVAPAQDGMISSVPWGDNASGAAGPSQGAPFGLSGPDQGAAQPDPETGSAEPSPDVAVDTGGLPVGPMVLAVRCSSGHHNAPHATRCRVCGQELPSQQPEQTPRPALGLLRLSTGDVVTLDRGVLAGRAPRASTEASGARAPHLVRIASPDNEISRNHLEIVLDGWHVLVRDLGSTNGTTVALPGSSPVRVRPGDQQTIDPGTTITLADQVSMVFEVTG